MSLKDYLDINPLRTLAAILGFGQAIIVLLYLIWSWDSEVAVAINTVWVAFMGIWMSLFKQGTPE